ncbi:hypothetical protein AB0H15_12345 [Streptomyces milbemycinicus]
MTTDLDATLITAHYVKIDDESGGPRWLGRPPLLTDSELVCVAVAQAMLGFTSEAHWLGYAVKRVIRMLAKSSDFWLDDCWIVDSTPVPAVCRGPPLL